MIRVVIGLAALLTIALLGWAMVTVSRTRAHPLVLVIMLAGIGVGVATERAIAAWG